MLLALALGLGLTAAYAAALVTVAWRLGVRRGRHWLPVAWIVGGVVFAMLMLAKLRAQGAAIGVGAFFGGKLLVLLIVAVNDVAALVRQWAGEIP